MQLPFLSLDTPTKHNRESRRMRRVPTSCSFPHSLQTLHSLNPFRAREYLPLLRLTSLSFALSIIHVCIYPALVLLLAALGRPAGRPPV